MAILSQLARIPKIIPFAHLWSEEISDLLYLRLHSGGVQHCWEENTDIYVFRISDLIKKYALKTVNKRLSRKILSVTPMPALSSVGSDIVHSRSCKLDVKRMKSQRSKRANSSFMR